MVAYVAEFTTNPMGHLGLLLRMVDAAKAAGATFIKMQKKDVERYYTQEKLDAAYSSPFGETYRDYRTMFEFDGLDWWRFVMHCRKRNMPWFATAQDIPSLDELLNFGMRRVKIASSQARNHELLEQVVSMLDPSHEVVLSVAGSTLKEIEHALEVFQVQRRIWLLHCVAEYPCSDDRLRLGNIPALRKAFGSDRIRIGYSGHERGWQGTLAAVKLGAEMVERHFCLSRHSFVHHIECSLTPNEFSTMIRECEGGTEPDITQEAYRSEFGMADAERSFLVDQTYGRAYLGDSSRM